MPSEPNAQQTDGVLKGAIEDALDKWWYEDHFGDGCDIDDGAPKHSERCVDAAFKDGYEAGRRAPIPPASPEHPLTIRYTNHRGKTSIRHVIPQRLWFGVTEWHPEPQWLLDAHDFDKDSARTFALNGIGQPVSPEREAVYRTVDALIDLGSEPESPDHVCTLGVTECDSICMTWALWADARRALMSRLQSAAARAIFGSRTMRE